MKQFFFLLILTISVSLKAEMTSVYPLRHHIIIAIDKAGCDDWIGKDEVKHKILKLLREDVFRLIKLDSMANSGSRKLFEEGDYLSIVGFRINTDQSDMNVFAMPMNNRGSNIAYSIFTQKQLNNFVGKGWQQIALQPYNPGKGPFSLVSVAKAYALAALKSEGQYVNRTFLIMISDKHYNGNIFYDEMQAFCDQQQGEKLTPQKIFSKCYEVEQNYVIKYISTQFIWGANKKTPQGYVEFYEYMPLLQNFTLSTVINFPTHLVARLRRDGSYGIELPMSWQGRDHYRLLRLEAFPINQEKPIYKAPNFYIKKDTITEDIVQFTVPSNRSAKSIQVRAWLRYIDGFYNATFMSPEWYSSNEFGRDGLNHIIPIEYEDDETILGIPVSVLFWPPFVENQHQAALVWKFFLGILFLGCLICFIRWLRKPRYYIPNQIYWPDKSSYNETHNI